MIKKWLEFINENIDYKSIVYPIKEYEFNDIFISLIDNGYEIETLYGFYREDRNESFTKEIIGDIRLCINLEIMISDETTTTDVTNDFKRAISKILKKSQKVPGELYYNESKKCEFKFSVSNRVYGWVDVDIDNLIISNGFKKTTTSTSTVFDRLNIDIIIGDQMNANPKMAIEYYKIKNTKDKNDLIINKNNVYYEILYKDLVESLVSNKNSYKEYLIGNDSIMAELNYVVDIDSIMYTLDIENTKMFIKYLIKEYKDNFDEYFLDNYKLEHSGDVDKDIEMMLSNTRELYKIIRQITIDEDDELVSELKSEYLRQEESALVDEQYRALEKDFERKVAQEFGQECRMIQKMLDGHPTTYFQFDVTMSWFEDYNDADEIFEHRISDLFEHRIADMCIDLSPDFPDYGSVDDEYFNREAKVLINNYYSE